MSKQKLKSHIKNFFCRSVLLTFFLMMFALNCLSQNNLGTELTEIKIEVRKMVKSNVDALVNEKKSKEKSEVSKAFETLPISKVPVLEEDESLIIKFCADCKGRKFEDLGFSKMIVFFVNPASMYADFNNSAKAFREIEFDTKSKKKKILLYKEHEFKVPYRSIPLIFFVSGGDYRHDIKKIILEKQADVIKLGEQSNILIDLPQAVQYLVQVKEVLNTPAAYNSRVAQSLLQRAQFFRLDRTNCFYQPLYADDRDRLECLAKNFNADQFEKDLNNLNFDKYGKLVGQETVSQLRNKYDGLNVFLDATVAVIELVGAMFKKKPLNIQIGSISPTSNDYLSLRQIPVNTQANTERALLLAPLKWREKEEIPTRKALNYVDFLPERECLQPGKNIFWFETGNALVKKEINKISIEFESAADASQKQIFEEIPVNQMDGSVSLFFDEVVWKKLKNWQKIKGKAVFKYNFETIEKEFDVKILPTANWRIIQSSNQALRRGEDSILNITPNTVRRDCLTKIVIKDQKNQEIQMIPFRGFQSEQNGTVKLFLSAQDKEKLQPGKISINIYENDSEAASGKLSAELLNKKPQYQFTAHSGDVYAEIKGERLDEIKSLTINDQKGEIDFNAGKIDLPNPIAGAQISVDVELKAGDVINQKAEVLPSRPKISGDLGCLSGENQSRLIIEKKTVYKPYELPDCIYPTDTDEIKLILVADRNYSFSFANKPAITVSFTKEENLIKTTNTNNKFPLLNAATVQILSPNRLDASIKLDQKAREQLEDGNRLFLKITDPIRGESDWYPIKAKFLRLPIAFQINCISNTEKPSDKNMTPVVVNQSTTPPSSCELSGNLSMLENVFIKKENGSENVYQVNTTSDKISIPGLSEKDIFFIKLRNYASKMKVDFANSQNTSVSYIQKKQN